MSKLCSVFGMAAALMLAGCTSPSETSNNQVIDNRADAAGQATGQAFNDVVDSDVLTEMFRWWNKAYTEPTGFTADSFGQYFTDDAVMRINGKTRATGLQDLASHFRQIQKNTDAVKINLPFIASFSSPDGSKIYTYHTIDASEGGKPGHEMVMGYAEIRDGKIAVIDFLSLEGQPEDSGT